MPDEQTSIDPRYLTYNKEEVQEILDNRLQSEENNDPVTLLLNSN